MNDITACANLAELIYSDFKKCPGVSIYIYNIFDYKLSDEFSLTSIKISLQRDEDEINKIQTILVHVDQFENMYSQSTKTLFITPYFSINKKKITAYQLFYDEQYRILRGNNPEIAERRIHSQIIETWKNIKTDPEKSTIYFEKARLLKENKKCGNEQKLFNVLYNILQLRINYKYSKLMDELLEVEVFDKTELETQCLNHICGKEKFECCVCMEQVSDSCKTDCKHYVCRLCIEQLKEPLCPMCRKSYY